MRIAKKANAVYLNNPRRHKQDLHNRGSDTCAKQYRHGGRRHYPLVVQKALLYKRDRAVRKRRNKAGWEKEKYSNEII
jgi:hypothetical protein